MAFKLSPRSEPVQVMYWLRTFDGRPSAAREVRRFVSALLPTCSRLDEVLLVVDELVVNALRHTKSGQDGGSFTVEIAAEVAADGGHLTVSVEDEGGPAEPMVVQADDLDESGRGLRTVSLLATAWGWYGNEASRTVHAAFELGAQGHGPAPDPGHEAAADRHGLHPSHTGLNRSASSAAVASSAAAADRGIEAEPFTHPGPKRRMSTVA